MAGKVLSEMTVTTFTQIMKRLCNVITQGSRLLKGQLDKASSVMATLQGRLAQYRFLSLAMKRLGGVHNL